MTGVLAIFYFFFLIEGAAPPLLIQTLLALDGLFGCLFPRGDSPPTFPSVPLRSLALNIGFFLVLSPLDVLEGYPILITPLFFSSC